VNDSQDHEPADRGHQARMCLESFDKFYKLYQPRLVRFLKSQASDTGWAEEVADDAMMAAWDKWDDLLTCERPDSWLFMVATRKLRQLEARARERCCLDEDLASSEGDLRLAAATDEWVEDHIDLIAGLRSLPRRQCEVIGLYYLVGYTLPETAQILGIQESAAEKHLNRGLESLRQRQGISASPMLIRRNTG
jgi:RNA polymerase sigma factor (sigma-70 family)